MAPRILRPGPALPQLKRQMEQDEAETPRWVTPLKFALIALFALFLFWLVNQMVAHHFFSGGAQNSGNRPIGP